MADEDHYSSLGKFLSDPCIRPQRAVWLVLLAFIMMLCDQHQEAFAQNKLDRQNQKKMRELPHEQLVEWTLAQAELLNAESERTRADAQAILALTAIGNAQSQSLLDAKANMEIFRSYWQKKAERKDEDRKAVEQKLENRQLLEVERRSALTAQWDSLFKPERMQIAKLKGTPQNLMLALLSERTEISYSQSLPSGVNLKDTSAFTLNSDILNAIRVSSPTLSGPRMTFALTDPMPIDMTWLPTLLRHEDFAGNSGDRAFLSADDRRAARRFTIARPRGQHVDSNLRKHFAGDPRVTGKVRGDSRRENVSPYRNGCFASLESAQRNTRRLAYSARD